MKNNNTDSRIKEYTKKGEVFYKFRIYAGINEQTGISKKINRGNFKSVKEAEKELKRLDYQISSGMLKAPKPINMTFTDVYNEWFDSYINTVRESTWYKRKRMFELHLLPAFGKYRVRAITSNQIQRELNKWFDITDYNYKVWFNYTKLILKFAVIQGYITDNPCNRVIMPKKTDYNDEIPNFWDKDQLGTFFKCIDSKKELEKYTLFRVLAFTGIRRAECLALTWKDLNVMESRLKIDKTLAQGVKGRLLIQNTKTKKGNRIIPIDSMTMNYLKKWRNQQRKEYFMLGYNTDSVDQLIFASNKNSFKSLNTPRKWLLPLIKKSGLPAITIHGFRHSNTSALISAGVPVKEVQERLGHEDAQTTLNIYTHLTKDQQKEASDKLASFLKF